MTALPTLELLQAELLKVRKRWLPWILLVVLLLIVGLQVWLGGFVSWRASEEFDLRRDSLVLFELPWAIQGLLETLQYWGAILIAMLAASMVATEHGWGTVRQALVRGQPRSSYLTTKLAGVAVAGLLGFVAVFLVGILFCLLATAAAAGESIRFDVPGGPSFFDVVAMVGRAIYAMIPYVLLAFCVTVVSRSTTLGVAGILVYVIVEGIVVSILGGLGGTAADYRVLFIGHNVVGLLSANRIGGDTINSLAFRDSPEGADLPDPAASALVLAIYGAIFLAISYRVFLRRDLGVESGGSS